MFCENLQTGERISGWFRADARTVSSASDQIQHR